MLGGECLNESLVVVVRGVIAFLTLLILTRVLGTQQVAYAIVETSGKLSVLLKPGFHPVNRNDLNLAGPAEITTPELIFNGLLVEPNLKQVGVSEEWLMQQLQGQGIRNISEIFLATINAQGHLYVDLFRDKLATHIDIDDEPDQKVKQ